MAVTAPTTAAARARESRRPDRLFHYPLAAVLAEDEGIDLPDRGEGEMSQSADDASVAIRTRLLDDTLGWVLSEQHIDQVVIVAAGMGHQDVPAGLAARYDGVRAGPALTCSRSSRHGWR